MSSTLKFRDYTYLGSTQSLCPECLTVVPAKILDRGGRVYFRKSCPKHGVREDFVCSDVRWFDRQEYQTPGRVPVHMGVEPSLGCPYDCGLCTEHEQHTCLGLLEITSSCNLECPMCFAASGPGGKHLTFDECRQAIDHLVAAEGEPEILQLSGGEPTIHPQFLEIFEYACQQPIDLVMINTNGIRLARDQKFLEAVAEWRHRAEIYLQFDGFDDAVYQELRGEALVKTKLQAIEKLGELGIHTILVCTVQADVNEHEIARIVQFGMERPWITGVCFQPATYVGRYVLPAELEAAGYFPRCDSRHCRGLRRCVAGERFFANSLCTPECTHIGICLSRARLASAACSARRYRAAYRSTRGTNHVHPTTGQGTHRRGYFASMLSWR